MDKILHTADEGGQIYKCNKNGLCSNKTSYKNRQIEATVICQPMRYETGEVWNKSAKSFII